MTDQLSLDGVDLIERESHRVLRGAAVEVDSGIRRYNTPQVATHILLQRVPINGLVYEPCVGEAAISKVLASSSTREIVTNDIDPNVPADFHLDATKRSSWNRFGREPDWSVSNPEFNIAHQLVPIAFDWSKVGIAKLLRITWLEPTEDRQPRGEWLARHPPSHLIVLPRLSFKTVIRIEDGKEKKSTVDTATCAWYVWYKKPTAQTIEIVTKRELREAAKSFDIL